MTNRERLLRVAEFYRHTDRALPVDLQIRMLAVGIDIRRFV